MGVFPRSFKAIISLQPAIPINDPAGHPDALHRLLRSASIITGVPLAEITGPRRSSGPLEARYAYYHLARRLVPHASVSMIARVCGNRDHSTVAKVLLHMKGRRTSETFARLLTSIETLYLTTDKPT